MKRFHPKLSLKALVSIVLSSFWCVATLAQSQTIELPETPFSYAALELPAHFNDPQIIGADTQTGRNPLTDAGATLGRVLFYDKRLSLNDSTSCASCHEQSKGFSDSNVLSRGFEGGLTGRHSMGLSNTRFYAPDRFFWDERASTLEQQVLQPIQDEVEMGMSLEALNDKLQATTFYPVLFQNAFGTTEVTSDRIAMALAQFVRAMVSYQSKYDLGVAVNFANFTEQEQQGLNLYNSARTNCSRCHGTHLQIMSRARNNGLDTDTSADQGVGDGRFKSPSLRNIAVRAPFMHDGRFSTLEQVVEFYNSGVQPHAQLDRLLIRNGQPVRMRLSESESSALIAFLETLTDAAFLSDEKFSDPFVAQQDEAQDEGEAEDMSEVTSKTAFISVLNLLLDE